MSLSSNWVLVGHLPGPPQISLLAKARLSQRAHLPKAPVPMGTVETLAKKRDSLRHLARRALRPPTLLRVLGDGGELNRAC